MSLINIFKTGVKHCNNNDAIRKVVLINRITILLSFIMLVFSCVNFFQNNYIVLPFSIFYIFLFLLPLLLHYIGYIIFAKYLFSILLPLIASFMALFTGKDSGNLYFIFCTGLIPLIFFKNVKAIYTVFTFNMLLFFSVTYMQYNINSIIELPDQVLKQHYAINMLSVFIILFFTISFYRKSNENYEKELMHQKQIIQEKNKEIIDSISYAKRIQQAYLPPEDLFHKIFNDAFVLYKPKDIVSGDFYWFYSPEKKNVFLAVADCTGHGVPGALMSVICCNALNEATVNNKISSPDKILNTTRKIVKTNLKSTSNSSQKDGMDISLVFLDYTLYEEKQITNLSWSGANNNLWIYRYSSKQIEEYKGDKQPIGFHVNEKPFTPVELKLFKGDIIYLMSDGFADQFGGEKGKKLKYTNLQKLLLSLSDKPMNTLRSELLKSFENWKGDLEQVDDVCILGVRV